MGKIFDELFTQYQADIDTDRIDKVLERALTSWDYPMKTERK